MKTITANLTLLFLVFFTSQIKAQQNCSCYQNNAALYTTEINWEQTALGQQQNADQQQNQLFDNNQQYNGWNNQMPIQQPIQYSNDNNFQQNSYYQNLPEQPVVRGLRRLGIVGNVFSETGNILNSMSTIGTNIRSW